MTELVTGNDMIRSRTLRALPELMTLLRRLDGLIDGERMLDVGCGFGGLSMTVAAALGIPEVHGVDIDETVLDEARSKGIEALHVDISKEPLPYDSSTFDLVTSFGVLDYLPHFDDAMSEIVRVTKPGGYVVISLPNLGSWHNRLALLFGYQPRDVEFSKRVVPGVHPYYKRVDPLPTGHIHTVTARAFREFCETLDLETVDILGAAPRQLAHNDPTGSAGRWVDAVLTRFPALAKRFMYVGRKSAQQASAAGETALQDAV